MLSRLMASSESTGVVGIMAVHPLVEPARPLLRVGFLGSAQEFDGRAILSHFPKNDEFGLKGSHALGLEEQVA